MQDQHPSEAPETGASGTHGHTPGPKRCACGQYPDVCARYGHAGPPEDTHEPSTLDLLSAALDEIYALRRALAYEARVVEAQTLDLKSLARGRRLILTAAVMRMRGGVTQVRNAYSGISYKSLDAEARRHGCDYLTVASWEAEVISRLGGKS